MNRHAEWSQIMSVILTPYTGEDCHEHYDRFCWTGWKWKMRVSLEKITAILPEAFGVAPRPADARVKPYDEAVSDGCHPDAD